MDAVAIDPALTPEAITETHERIAPYIRRTPVVDIEGADVGREFARITLKLELLQHSGSFKARGAFAHLLGREIPAAGVVAASGGNHGAAVAYAAMRLGVAAKIFVPSVSSPAKIARIRDYGAELVVGGALYGDALAASQAWIADCGAIEVHAFDHPMTLLGQGTLGREFGAQAGDVDTVLVGVGGGGLAGGLAAWNRGAVKLIGVEPSSAPTLHRALQAGAPVDAPAGGIDADSLAPRRVGELMFPLARSYMAGVLLVQDEAIRAAQEALWKALRIVVEPGGAAAFAAVHSGAYRASPGEHVGIVVSGGNSTAVDFDR